MFATNIRAQPSTPSTIKPDLPAGTRYVGRSCKQIWKWRMALHVNELRWIVQRPISFTQRRVLVRVEGLGVITSLLLIY
jgi:hypothetical protein